MSLETSKEIAIAKDLANNTSILKTAALNNVADKTVQRVKKDYREFIEQANKQFIEDNLETALKQATYEIHKAKELSEVYVDALDQENIPARKLSYINKFLLRTDKIKEFMYEGVGIKPSHTLNQVIFNDNRSQVNNVMMGVLRNSLDFSDPDEDDE